MYKFIISELSPEDGGGFFAEFPDLPGCMADGDTIEELIKNAKSAQEAWLESAKKFHIEIPKQKIEQPKRYSGTLNVRIPVELHALLDKKAKENNTSLNQQILYTLTKGISFAL